MKRRALLQHGQGACDFERYVALSLSQHSNNADLIIYTLQYGQKSNLLTSA